MKRDYLLFLEDIVERIEKIDGYIENICFDEFKNDDKTVSACIREVEVIGEAAKQIPLEIRQRFDDLPWSLMAKMRDKLIHWYFDVDEEVVWKVCKEKLPQIGTKIKEMIVILDQKNQNQE